MYNFNFQENEELLEVFDPIYIKQGNIEKNTAVAVTTNRILFMAFVKDDPFEDMKAGRVIGQIKFKQVFFEIPLVNVEKVEDGELYKLTMYNGMDFEFENEDLYNLLLSVKK
jgi:hypothetical protein